jgi:2-polyprenyl-3-methyl-5-hydroxy-6-metoxy-1,4-benzoquinol methylase
MSTNLKTIQCFCGEEKYRTIKKIPYSDEYFKKIYTNATIVKCVNCNLLRTSPTPILDMPEIYEENSVSHSHEKNIELWKSFSLEIIEKLKPFKSSGKFLDIGCNIGVLVKVAKENGFEASGIDLSESAVSFGREHFHIDLKKEYLENILGENVFDVIVMNHVIEHIPNLKEFTSHIRRLLKPDGIFLSVCPNAESLIPTTLNLLNMKKTGRGSNWFWYGYLPEQHVWQFGPKTLSQILNQCQFHVIKTSAHQNMHWGMTEIPALRFRLLKFLWNLFAIINKGDNLFIWCSPNKNH